jgi:tRNA threonylcarbamoyladenosine biosynthesis protein TsaB
MRVLGINTATAVASVALLNDGELIAEQVYPEAECAARQGRHANRNHAEIIIPLIESVLLQAHVGLGDLDGIAVSIGPGSFTGVRIGLSTVKGLVYGFDLPVVGISTLHACAASLTCSEDLICPLLDARKKEVYVALFRRHGAQLERLTEDLVMPVAAAIEKIAAHARTSTCRLVGEGAAVYAPGFKSALGAQVCIDHERGQRSLAAAAADLGAQRIGRSESDELSGLLPVYVRLPEAESKPKQL